MSVALHGTSVASPRGMQTHVIHVDSPYNLVVELGRREVVSAWTLRYCRGKAGLEAYIASNRMIRLELAEPDEPAEPAAA